MHDKNKRASNLDIIKGTGTDHSLWVRNCWYVAAWCHEVTVHQMHAITIINKPQITEMMMVKEVESPASIQAIPLQPKMVKKPTRFLKDIKENSIQNQ